MQNFTGAKLVLFIGDKLVTILRDDIPTIPWPDHWDLPGGGREGAETPEECVLRELQEELGLNLSPSAIVWRHQVDSVSKPKNLAYYFGARLPKGAERDIVFGNEGQEWRLVEPEWYLTHPKTIPYFQKVITIAQASF